MFANRVLVAVACCVLLACAPTRADDVKPMKPPMPPGVVQPVAPAKAPQPRTFAVYFKDAKWADVFDWYAKETGLTLITAAKPKGTFTFTPPKDAQFTVAEFTDVINDALAAQKFILIRRHMTFYLHDWTEKLEARDREGMFPRITLDDLPTRGRTELVQVVLVIKRADELAVVDELKKLSGPFGYLVPLPNGMLVVSDTAGNVAKIKKRLDELDAPKPMPQPAPPACGPAKEPAPKKLGVIRAPDLDTDRTVTLLRELFPQETGIARLPLLDGILVWGTDEEIATIRHGLTSR